MIIDLTAENVYNYLSNNTAISSLCELYSDKIDDGSLATWSYAYIKVITNRPKSYSNIWYIMKSARISFHIICKETLGATDTPERVLSKIIQAITNNLVSSGKQVRVDWINCHSILEDTVSPIFKVDNRHYQVKDYLFNYTSLTNE